MHSNVKNLFFVLISSLYLMACTPSHPIDHEGENAIGEKLQTMSTLKRQDGTQLDDVVFFDETVRKIHHFNVTDMSYVKSISVKNPSDKHYVLFEEHGNFIADISAKNASFYNKTGRVQRSPFTFQGTPVSAAFRSDIKTLVIYDDLMTVGILKFDADGNITKSWMGGPDLKDNVSLSAGDLNEAGQMIVTLSDGTLAVVDVDQTLAQQKWIVSSEFATGLKDLSWIAPITGHPEQAFVRSASALTLFDLITKTAISTLDLSKYSVEKYSKSGDGHLLLRRIDASTAASDQELHIAYVQNNQVLEKVLFKQSQRLLSSQLDLKNNTWGYVAAFDPSRINYYNEIDQIKKGRKLRIYRFSDKVAIENRDLDDGAQIHVANNYYFALKASEVGYAIRYDLFADTKAELKYFNLRALQ